MKFIVRSVGYNYLWEVGVIEDGRFKKESSWGHEGIANQRAHILNNPSICVRGNELKGAVSRLNKEIARLRNQSCAEDDGYSVDLGSHF